MKYFIDFEATQFSKEVISIGCVREDGQTFYSLIAPVDGKITPFITNLTGITAEAVANAMNPDYVFEKFYEWAFTDKDNTPDFYCWGDSDVDFLQHTFKRTTSLTARFAIGYMCGSLIDYSKMVSKRVNMDGKNLALLRVQKCFDPNSTQNHNALDDAVMLYNIYKEITNRPIEEIKKLIRAEYPQDIESVKYVRWNQMNYPVGTICILNKHKVATMTFANVHEAAEWIIKEKVSAEQQATANVTNIEKKILKACNGTNYYAMKWVMVKEEN
jgi:DNA polymerase III epsilon subunit-like protein